MDFFILLFVVFIILFGYILFRKSSPRPFRRKRSAGPPRIYDAGEPWTTTHPLTADPVSDSAANFTHHSGVDSSGSYDPGGGWTATDYTNTSDASYTSADLGDGFGGGDAGGGGAGGSWDAGGGGDFSGGGDFGGGGGDTGGGGVN